MKTRILRPEEWDKINAPDLPELLKFCNPSDVAVVVVEKDDEIVASVMVMKVTHFEGLWIKPEERGNAGVFRSLIRQAYSIPACRSEHFVLADAAANDDRMQSVCRRLGGKDLHRKLFVLPVGV